MKTLNEQVNDILRDNKSAASKARALIKLGITPYEANVMARTYVRVTVPRTPRTVFTYTFGVEIECVNCGHSEFFAAARRNGLSVYEQVYYNHRDMAQYKLTTDSSISGDRPAECVTPPLNSRGGFESLKNCCKSLREIGATANSSCGLHVHIGAEKLTDEEYCNVFVNYMRLEKAIESFLAPSRRGTNAQWCKSLRPHASDVLAATTKHEMLNALHCDRYHRVNPVSYGSHKTIEFRQHQGSTNFTKIEAWVKFLGKLVEYSTTHRMNSDIDRIEDIPFLSDSEKTYFIARRTSFGA